MATLKKAQIATVNCLTTRNAQNVRVVKAIRAVLAVDGRFALKLVPQGGKLTPIAPAPAAGVGSAKR